jgi:hypothetical protein
VLKPADPISLITKFAKSVIVSAPEDQSPARFDWERWISNTALKFSNFTKPAPQRIIVLESEGRRINSGGAIGNLARHDVRDVDLIDLISFCRERSLILLNAVWQYRQSSWLESYRSVSHAKFSTALQPFFECQLQLWKKLETYYRDDAHFIVTDGAHRFINAGEYCRMWTQRLERTKVTNEPKVKSWATGLLSITPDSIPSEGGTRLHRLLAIDPIDWSGQPQWHLDLPNLLVTALQQSSELWISMPYAVTTMDLHAKMKQIAQNSMLEIHAPSTVLGWHPCRDMIMYLTSKSERKFFIYLDHSERMQFVFSEPMVTTKTASH